MFGSEPDSNSYMCPLIIALSRIFPLLLMLVLVSTVGVAFGWCVNFSGHLISIFLFSHMYEYQYGMYKTVMASSFVFAQRPTYALHYCKTAFVDFGTKKDGEAVGIFCDVDDECLDSEKYHHRPIPAAAAEPYMTTKSGRWRE